MARETQAKPERKALRVPWGQQLPDGTFVDGYRTLEPGDHGYDDAYETALFWHTEGGQPMPYADASDQHAGGGMSRNPVAREAASGHTEAMETEGHWVTIRGVHLFVDGAGLIVKGPRRMLGGHVSHIIPGKEHAPGHVPAGHDQHPSYAEHRGPDKPKPLVQRQTVAFLHEAIGEAQRQRQRDADDEGDDLADLYDEGDYPVFDESKLPTIDSLDRIVTWAQKLHRAGYHVYIRFSRGPAADSKGGWRSRNYQTGGVEPGLSVNNLASDVLDNTRDDMVESIVSYAHMLEQGGAGTRAYLLRGREVARGSDNEPIVRDVQPVAWVGDKAIADARALWHENDERRQAQKRAARGRD